MQVIEVRYSLILIHQLLRSLQLYDENIVEVPSGQLVRLPEFGSRLSIGEKNEVSLYFLSKVIPRLIVICQNILPPVGGAGGVQNYLGFLFGSNRTGGMQTVIAVKHTVYAIAWLALNQTVGASIDIHFGSVTITS